MQYHSSIQFRHKIYFREVVVLDPEEEVVATAKNVNGNKKNNRKEVVNLTIYDFMDVGGDAV